MVESKNFSFKGWSIFSYVKGRKKLVVAAIGYGLGLFITDSHTVATASAASVELIFALCEYYIKKQKK